MQMKQCRTCPNSYPATKEYFVADKKSRDGLCSECKTCRNSRKKAYDDVNREKVRAQKRASASRTREKNHERSRRWLQDPKNVETARARARLHYWNHREEKIAQVARWQRDNREHVNEWTRENNKKRRASDPEYAARMRAKVTVRRNRRRAAGGSFTREDIALMFKNQKGRCWYCQKSIKKGYHIEHRVPISRGGSSDPSNLVLSCAFCNLSKHDKLPHEWSDRLL